MKKVHKKVENAEKIIIINITGKRYPQNKQRYFMENLNVIHKLSTFCGLFVIYNVHYCVFVYILNMGLKNLIFQYMDFLWFHLKNAVIMQFFNGFEIYFA